MTVTVSELNVYPIKGCKGISAPAAKVLKTGLAWDRAWMVVRASDGRYLSQREYGKLAKVTPSMPMEAMADPESAVQGEGKMFISSPGVDSTLTISLCTPPSSQTMNVTVWEWKGVGLDEGEPAAEWFTNFLGIPCRLVRYIGSESAPALGLPPILPDVAAAKGGDQDKVVVRPTEVAFAEGGETRFSDGYPMLLASESSLADLNKRLAQSEGAATMQGLLPLPMKRFRPNMVMAGAPAWEEDKWREVQITTSVGGEGGGGASSAVFHSVKPCSRCKVTTINPETGEASEGEPLDVLSTFRKGTDLGWALKSWKHAVHFAWNLTPTEQAIGKVIRVGETITLSQPQQSW